MNGFRMIYPGYFARGLDRISREGKGFTAYTIFDTGDRVDPRNGMVTHIRNKAGNIKHFRTADAAAAAFPKEN